jgi:Asp/Glu/hydantoin racemase
MKILTINPNSDPEMTDIIERSAAAYAGDEFQVVCKLTPGAPLFIETNEDILQAAPGMMSLLKESEAEFDAFVVACHDDPNLVGECPCSKGQQVGHAPLLLYNTLYEQKGTVCNTRR